MTMSILLHAGCAALYILLAGVVLLARRRDISNFVLAGSCLITAIWAGGVAFEAGFAGDDVADDHMTRLLELAQQAAWYGFVLYLYDRSVPDGSRLGRLLSLLGLIGILLVAVSLAAATPLAAGLGIRPDTLFLFGLDARLGLAICTILLIENVYRNADEDLRWHVALPCVALGGLFVYHVVLYSDAALFRRTSPVLFDGRAVVTALLTPLLAVAARRNQRRWGPARSRLDIALANGVEPRRRPSRPHAGRVQVSHQAVFYSASLVVTGVFLVALAFTGELLRSFGPGQASGWSAMIEVSLIFGGVLGVAVLITSRSAHSALRNMVINNFLTRRYDYRIEWLRCIETLSQTDSYVALHLRVIKAVAQVVDSPAGMVFLREAPGAAAAAAIQDNGPFRWAGSWNLPALVNLIMPEHSLVQGFADGSRVVEAPEGMPWLDAATEAGEMQELWLAVPLSHGAALLGFILLSRPRARFVLDQEVFALLRIVGQEVASHIAEQRAAEALIEARQLREYGQRFAFVAHDIKNVASQLALLLANAEHHLANPAFQRDMLTTIGGSVQKITALLARLKAPAEAPAVSSAAAPAPSLSVGDRLSLLIGSYPTARRARIELRDPAPGMSDAVGDKVGEARICMDAAAFDAVITHLLDNAFEASAPDAKVVIACRRREGRVQIDIVDQGTGMTADFIRDQLFQPFRSSKSQGFGIGVYQARVLLRQAGGELLVTSAPGRGTTMHLSLPILGAVEEPATCTGPVTLSAQV